MFTVLAPSPEPLPDHRSMAAATVATARSLWRPTSQPPPDPPPDHGTTTVGRSSTVVIPRPTGGGHWVMGRSVLPVAPNGYLKNTLYCAVRVFNLIICLRVIYCGEPMNHSIPFQCFLHLVVAEIGNVSGSLTCITDLDQFTRIVKDTWPVKLGLEDFPWGGDDAVMSSGWSTMTLSKNLCCFIYGHASSYDPVSTLFE
ncbi:hypothetical protein Tco_0121713 [Tanacetum coccineum]